MKNRTLVHNTLKQERVLNWSVGQRKVSADGWIMLDGAYPDQCQDDSSHQQFGREVEAGSLKCWLVSDLRSIPFDEAVKMMEEARKAKAGEPVVPVAARKAAEPPQPPPAGLTAEKVEAKVSEVKVAEVKAEAPAPKVEPAKGELLMAVEAAPTAGTQVDRDPNDGLVGMFTADKKENGTFSTPVTELLQKTAETPIFPSPVKTDIRGPGADNRQSIFTATPAPSIPQAEKINQTSGFAAAEKARMKRGKK